MSLASSPAAVPRAAASMHPLESLISTGTRLWLDSIDPDLVRAFARLGATGATSNPVIVADLIATGRFDDELRRLAAGGLSAEEIAWRLTDQLVASAEQVFLPVFRATDGNDGYVSFELDPLIEDDAGALTQEARVARYIELGRAWSAGHPNRMIKVPATPAGLAAVGPLAAAGVPLNVTLVFSLRQYEAARDAIHDAALATGRQDSLKSVYSIFVSRIDQYTEKQVPQLGADAQGQVGIVNAQRIWQANQEFWKGRGFRHDQQIVFASTGTKKPSEIPWRYVAALAGSDIQTNPPATNQAVADSNESFVRRVDVLPPATVLDEIDSLVDFVRMENDLMAEGLEKFCSPQKKLLAMVAARRGG